MELLNNKQEVGKRLIDVERHRDNLLMDMENLQSQLETVRLTVDDQTERLVKKEQEINQRIQRAREEEWAKTQKVEDKKLELEEEMHRLQRQLTDESSRLQKAKDRYEKQLADIRAEKSAMEAECKELREKCRQMEEVRQRSEAAEEEAGRLRQRLQACQADQAELTGRAEREAEDMQRAKQRLETMHAELTSARADVQKLRDQSDSALRQQKESQLDERKQFESRINELQCKLSDLHSRTRKELNEYKEKKNRYVRATRQLKQEVEIVTAKLTSLEEQQKSSERTVPLNVFKKVKRQLEDMQRKHGEFRRVLFSCSPDPTSCGASLDPSPLKLPIGGTFPMAAHLPDQDARHQEELVSVRRRLDALDTQQREQLEELGGMLSGIIDEERTTQVRTTLTNASAT